MVTKETKKGTSQMDLRPGIYECRITADGSLEFLVDASSGGNIKPALLINALWRFAGQMCIRDRFKEFSRMSSFWLKFV